MRLGSLLLAVALLVPAPAIAQTADDVNAVLDTIFGEHAKFEEAFVALQQAVEAGNREAVAALAAYPLVVKVGERREVASPEEFVALYSEIMTEEIVDSVTGQDYAALFANDQGIMFGNGQVWMTGVCEDDACAVWNVRIITIQSTAE